MKRQYLGFTGMIAAAIFMLLFGVTHIAAVRGGAAVLEKLAASVSLFYGLALLPRACMGIMNLAPSLDGSAGDTCADALIDSMQIMFGGFSVGATVMVFMSRLGPRDMAFALGTAAILGGCAWMIDYTPRKSSGA